MTGKKKIIIASLLVIVIAIFVFAAINNSLNGGFGRNVQIVKVDTISRGEISAYITADGQTEEIEKHDIYFGTSLKVNDVLVEKGDFVKKGQKILDIDIGSLEAEIEKLETNKAIQKLSADTSTLDANIRNAEISLNNARRSYEDALKKHEENKEKYLASVITRDELDMSEDALIAAETAYKNAQNAYQSALDNKRIALKTAEENLKMLDISIKELRKQVDSVRENQYSPIDGVISALNLSDGSYTAPMQLAYSVSDISKLQVKANVKEYDSKNIMTGQKVRITGDAISSDLELYGVVKWVSPNATSNITAGGTETFVEVKIDFDNSAANLRPGMNVTCDIYTVDKKDVIVIPLESITYDKDGNKKVFVLDKNENVMRERQIKTGINSDMYIEVTEGLKEGELLILETKPAYRDGLRARAADKESK